MTKTPVQHLFESNIQYFLQFLWSTTSTEKTKRSEVALSTVNNNSRPTTIITKDIKRRYTKDNLKMLN